MKQLVVSLHDVHPSVGEAIAEQRDWLRGLGISRASLLVVPDWHFVEPLESAPSLKIWLDEAQQRGDELVLHGFHHLRRRSPHRWTDRFWTDFYTTNEAEFLDLSREEACALFEKGRQVMKQSGWTPRGFIAPAWLMSPAVLDAVFTEDFLYTNTVRGIWAGSRQWIPCQSLCWSVRSAWRRQLSLAWNAYLARKVFSQNCIARLSLHPLDHKIPAVRTQIEHILTEFIQQGWSPTTYAQIVTAEEK